jgi:transcriptional regulator with XRE-family HTH domain
VHLAARGRSLRQLAKATGLSPAYLSLVANGQQRISLAALHLLLSQCEGVER